MDKIGEYIRRIEIDSLWSGQKHIVWELNRKVNILSGVNGVGKSTILNKVILRLLHEFLIGGGRFHFNSHGLQGEVFAIYGF